MQIDWRLKSAIFGVLDSLPPSVLHFAQRQLTGRSRSRLTSFRHVWEFHTENLRGRDIRRIVEFGAGKSLIQNLYLSALGIEQLVVDLNRMFEPELADRGLRALLEMGMDLDPRPIRHVADLERYGIHYRAPYDIRATEHADGAFDACVSTNTLQHIPVADLRAALAEVRRLLHDRGILSAYIDYSDNYQHTDRRISGLNYLRYDERQWARHNHRVHYQNRLRHGHYVAIFREVGFETITAEALDPAPAMPARIRPELLAGDGNDFFLHGRFLLHAGAPR